MAGTTTLQGHGGALAVAAAARHGVTELFTLSGGHVFPLLDGAVHADPPLRLLDVRHEQTAVFAAEATAKLLRRPGVGAPGPLDQQAPVHAGGGGGQADPDPHAASSRWLAVPAATWYGCRPRPGGHPGSADAHPAVTAGQRMLTRRSPRVSG